MNNVTLFSTRRCVFCTRAKTLLEARGIAFTEVPLDNDPDARADLVDRTGRRTVPQIFVGDVHVGGFQELAKLDRSGDLDELLDRHGITYRP